MSKTKEEYLQQQYSAKVLNWDKVYKQNPIIIKSAHEAADLYAEQQSIEFAEYLQFNYRTVGVVGFWEDEKGETFETKELYQLFLNDQNK